MRKQDINKLIPELRFPEFENDGGWVEKSIQKLINENEIVSHLDGNHGALYPRAEEFSKEGIPYISANDFITGLIDFSKCKYLPVQKAKKFRKGVAKDGDILFAHNATVGPVAKLKTDFPFVVLSTTATYFRCDNKNLNNDFLMFALMSPTFIKQYSRVMSQSTRNQIPITAQRIFILQIPKPQEQQKIASCLSSLDEVIAAHSQKLDALKEHKKGLMQNLFPQEGEAVPRYRFDEFANDGDWVSVKVETYIDLFSGIALKSEELSDDKSGIPILRGINITEGYIRHSKDIDKYFLGEIESLKKYLIREHDIVIGMDGSKVGKNIALIKKEDENSILIQRVARIRANKKTDIKYLYQHFSSKQFISYVDTVNTSSGIPHISAQQIKDFKIGFPPKINEQEKIASCLSASDELITLQSKKLEQLKLHKKGLMQGLFPKINE